MRALLEAGAVCGLSVLIGWSAYVWMIGEPKDRLLTAQQALRLEVGLSKQAQQLRKQIGAARQRLGPSEALPPGDLGISDLLDVLSHDLDELAVGERRWKLEPAVVGSGYQDLVVSLGLTCSFDTMAQLLQRIDAYPGSVRVSQLALRRRAGNSSLEVTLDLLNRVELPISGTQRWGASP